MRALITAATPSRIRGFSLIEVLVTLVVLLFGLLALASLLARTHTAEFESYQRKQAVILLEDMVGRIATNRNAASCYALTTNASAGTPYLGTDSATTINCVAGTADPKVPSAEDAARANSDVSDWSNSLKGTAEVAGTSKLGAALEARGCIFNNGAVTGYSGVIQYTVSVTWRGTSAMDLPADDTGCAKATYDADDRLRRIISAVVRVPVSLN